MLVVKTGDKNYIFSPPVPIECQVAAENVFDHNPFHKIENGRSQVYPGDALFKMWLSLCSDVEALVGSHSLNFGHPLKPTNLESRKNALNENKKVTDVSKLFLYMSPDGVFNNDGKSVLSLEKIASRINMVLDTPDFDMLKTYEGSVLDHYGFISSDLNYMVPDLLNRLGFLRVPKRTNDLYAGSEIHILDGCDLTSGIKRQLVNSSYLVNEKNNSFRVTSNFEYALFSRQRKKQIGHITKSVMTTNLKRTPFV